MSKNPALKNITAYLIEEASAEEEELLGQNEPTEESDEKEPAVFQVSYPTFSHPSYFLRT